MPPPSWRNADASEAERRGLAKLAPLRGRRIVVTGGCGFLGRHIVEMLVGAGARVVAFDIAVREEYSREVEFVTGDLMDDATLRRVFKGAWAVIHVASPPPTCNNPPLFMRVNVEGSRKVVEIARECGAEKVVYTSSASVVFDGNDQLAFDEQTPVPQLPMDAYTRSKRMGEAEVLKAAGTGVAVCSLRPHGIFGPRDPHMVPALSRAGAANKSKYMIGDGGNVVDFTYVGNVAYAHALAAVQLAPGAAIDGNAYFITNRDPVLFWDLITDIQRYFGHPVPRVPIPVGVMMPMARAAEAAARVVPFTPTFTKQSVTYAGKHHYYSSERAARDFGYQPVVPMDEAVRRTCESFAHLRRDGAADALAAHAARVAEPGHVARAAGPGASGARALLLGAAVVAALLALGAPPALAAAVAALVVYRAYRSAFGYAVRPFPFDDEAAGLRGRVAVVTGANKGVGLATARGLARLGATVVVACRSRERGERAAAEVGSGAHFMQLDLASLASVRAFVAAYTKRHGAGSLAVLVNNAGAMLPKGTTEDGLDEQTQVNYLGPFALTAALLDANAMGPSARVVNVTSNRHRAGLVDFGDLNCERAGAYSPFQVYQNTKLMQILFSNELHRRLGHAATADARMCSVAVHPGAVDTDFVGHFLPAWLAAAVRPVLRGCFTVSSEQSAATVLFAAAHPHMRTVGGQYVENSRVVRPDQLARDADVARRLWEESERLVGRK